MNKKTRRRNSTSSHKNFSTASKILSLSRFRGKITRNFCVYEISCQSIGSHYPPKSAPEFNTSKQTPKFHLSSTSDSVGPRFPTNHHPPSLHPLSSPRPLLLARAKLFLWKMKLSAPVSRNNDGNDGRHASRYDRERRNRAAASLHRERIQTLRALG